MTTMAVLVALGLVGGLPVSAALATGLAVLQPGFVVAGAVAQRLVVVARGAGLDEESTILAAVAGELRAGRSLRQALGSGSSSGPNHPMRRVARLASLGVPLSDLEPHIREALPKSSMLVLPAIGMLEASGGSAASVFELLAESHAVQTSLDAERRAALAPARLSAVILLALTVGAMLWLVTTGRVASLLEDHVGRVLAAVGLSLIGAGVGTFLILLRGGARS